MNDGEGDSRDPLAGLRVAEAESRRLQEKLNDPRFRRALELRELAWRTAMSRNGDRSQAMALIQEASAIDPEYAPQVAAIRDYFERNDRRGAVSLPKAINRIIVPLLASRGFHLRHPSSTPSAWRRGCEFVRSREGREQRISIASEKHGKRLGLLVALEKESGEYTYRDHRGFGCAHEELAYLNQDELDAVTARLASLLEAEILPWLDARDTGG